MAKPDALEEPHRRGWPSLDSQTTRQDLCSFGLITDRAMRTVLELGGAGNSLSMRFYDTSAALEMYLVEPNSKLSRELKSNIRCMDPDFAAETHAIPYGVEQVEKLK